MNTDKLQAKIDGMTQEELFHAMYTDHTTGALNRRAFEELYTPGAPIAIVDMDSLKWVNDTYGHRTGDKMLRRLSVALMRYAESDCVFRLSGDEFAVIGRNIPSACIKAKTEFPGISLGMAYRLEDADQVLVADKARRERSGLRAPRGETPPWANK